MLDRQEVLGSNPDHSEYAVSPTENPDVTIIIFKIPFEEYIKWQYDDMITQNVVTVAHGHSQLEGISLQCVAGLSVGIEYLMEGERSDEGGVNPPTPPYILLPIHYFSFIIFDERRGRSGPPQPTGLIGRNTA
ncbi:hypothetical protein EVAR_45576_1 [Eumeta japonica]|uniref:Uncharacterized protein n=1 Tax=Eumeta variegata TaxID=151549 RepID=A0A4C1YWC5_EUMVA|nr:hypothetical protein EVAR_45576_1 [Eumeta japonica]